MKTIIFILLTALCLTSCEYEEVNPGKPRENQTGATPRPQNK